jgi:DNA-binding MarR family transcriptional regulator
MVDAQWLDDVEDAAWRGLRRINVLTLAAIASELQRDSQLSDADYEVLSGLTESPRDRLRFGDLAAATRWSTSRLSHHVDRMHGPGLVERTPSEDDARGTIVILTALGRSTIEAAAPCHVRSVRRHIFDRLTAEQTAQLADIVACVLAPAEVDSA